MTSILRSLPLLVKAWKKPPAELLNQKLVVVLTGIPGASKTLSVLRAVRRIHSVVVFAVPRRALRRWVASEASKMLPEHEVVEFKAKYEFPGCPLRRGEFENLLDYLAQCILNKKSKACPHPCPFAEQVMELQWKARKGSLFIVATHVGMAFLSLILDYIDLLIIDEFEDYIAGLSSISVPAKSVERLLESEDKVLREAAEKIKAIMVYDKDTDRYYFPVVSPNTRVVVAITATWSHDFAAAFPFKHKSIRETIKAKYGEKDKVIVADKLITDKMLSEHRERIVELICSGALTAVEHGLTVGIVAKKKSLAAEIHDKLLARDVDAYYGGDYREAKKHQVVIVVPGDKIYRGLSLDRDVVIAMYQRWNRDASSITIHPEIDLLSNCNGEGAYKLVEHMEMAANVQALFRFIRNHSKEHLVVILDKRMYTALRHFMEDSYLRYGASVEATDSMISAVAWLKRQIVLKRGA